MADASKPLERYIRQVRYPPIGEDGQTRIGNSTALICGCGALGSMLANTLARAGVGTIRLVDRDYLETSNLQRQVLYDEQDVADHLPKAIAAANKLGRINSEISIEPVVADVDHRSIQDLARGVDILVDGTDNFETRFLVNDWCLRESVPWVYGGCVGAEGQCMTIVPGQTPCLRCLHHEPPPPGSTPTCDTAGILSPIVGVIASLQAMEALKILSGNPSAINRTLYVVDLWDNQVRQIDMSSLRDAGHCPACRHEAFPWLEGRRGSHAAVLCGRNAVQLHLRDGESVALDELAKSVQGVGRVVTNPYLLRLEVDPYLITVFSDGRAIVVGTDDVATAKTVYAKYVGV